MIFWEGQKALTTLYEKMTESVRKKYDLTQIEFDVLMFLHNNPQYKTATDVVKIRKLAKSHVSLAISALQNKRYLSARHENGNKKTVVLAITENATTLISDGERAQIDFGKTLFDGFSQSEMDYCKKMFLRTCENANKTLAEKYSQ